MEHGRVADHDRLIRTLGRDRGLPIEPIQDPIHRRHDRGSQLIDAVRPVHRVADTRDDIGSKWSLAVERGAHCRGHPRAQVHQRADQRGRADVKRDPETFLTRVAGFDRDQLLPRQDRGHLEAGVAKDLGQGPQHRHARGHVMALGRERFAEPRDVAALIDQVRLGQLEEDLTDVGIDDDQAAESHRRRLRHAEQLRHLAGHVLVDARLTRQSPSVLDLFAP